MYAELKVVTLEFHFLTKSVNRCSMLVLHTVLPVIIPSERLMVFLNIINFRKILCIIVHM